MDDMANGLPGAEAVLGRVTGKNAHANFHEAYSDSQAILAYAIQNSPDEALSEFLVPIYKGRKATVAQDDDALEQHDTTGTLAALAGFLQAPAGKDAVKAMQGMSDADARVSMHDMSLQLAGKGVEKWMVRNGAVPEQAAAVAGKLTTAYVERTALARAAHLLDAGHPVKVGVQDVPAADPPGPKVAPISVPSGGQPVPENDSQATAKRVFIRCEKGMLPFLASQSGLPGTPEYDYQRGGVEVEMNAEQLGKIAPFAADFSVTDVPAPHTSPEPVPPSPAIRNDDSTAPAPF